MLNPLVPVLSGADGVAAANWGRTEGGNRSPLYASAQIVFVEDKVKVPVGYVRPVVLPSEDCPAGSCIVYPVCLTQSTYNLRPSATRNLVHRRDTLGDVSLISSAWHRTGFNEDEPIGTR